MMISIEDFNNPVSNTYTEWVAHYCKFTTFNRFKISIIMKLLSEAYNSA